MSGNNALHEAPAWLNGLLEAKPERQRPAYTCTGDATPYGQAALEDERARVALAAKGTRNPTLNQAAFNLGQLVGGGVLDRATVEAALLDAAARAGLPENEARRTIQSGLTSGEKEPRRPESDKSYESYESYSSYPSYPIVSNRMKSYQSYPTAQANDRKFEGNLTAEIEEWVKNSKGSFTVADVDREFGLTIQSDKRRRSDALRTLLRKELILRDRRIAGRYFIVDQQVEWVDLSQTKVEPFPITLPLGLSDLVTIPRKAIIILAGTTNSGKTALALELLRLNLELRLPKNYLMSEMGAQEYLGRVQPLCDPAEWSAKVQAAEKSEGFDGIISKHNAHGLTVVDFLEEIEGEYYRIASDIRRIYDALGQGVALVCLQKRSNAAYAMGGEATAHKARLYLALDNLLHRPSCSVCSIKVVKAKSYPDRNPNGLERHFKIERGHKITPLSEWGYVNDKQREAMVKRYETMLDAPDVRARALGESAA